MLALDGLRGCAVLGVLLLHFTAVLEAPTSAGGEALKRAFSIGWTGVDLFFVLSGFLITGILLDLRGAPHPVRTFYVRRARRILPLYYLYLGVFFTGHALLRASGSPSLGQQLPYWLHVQNFLPSPVGMEYTSHLWSLAIEEQFYLVWPAVILLLSARGALRASLICVAGAMLYRVASVWAGADLGAVYLSTLGRMDLLGMGCAIALVRRMPGGADRLRRWAPAAIAAGGAVLAWVGTLPGGLNPASPYMLCAGYSAVALVFGGTLVLALDPPRRPLVRLLSMGWLRFFGRYSYAMYLLHLPLMFGANLIGVTPRGLEPQLGEAGSLIVFAGLMTGVTVLASLATWHLIERPLLRPQEALPAADAPGIRGASAV